MVRFLDYQISAAAYRSSMVEESSLKVVAPVAQSAARSRLGERFWDQTPAGASFYARKFFAGYTDVTARQLILTETDRPPLSAVLLTFTSAVDC